MYLRDRRKLQICIYCFQHPGMTGERPPFQFSILREITVKVRGYRIKTEETKEKEKEKEEMEGKKAPCMPLRT